MWRAVAPAFRPWRLLVAAKTALAATLAWYLGHLLPGEVGDYSYYAPLGALVSMAPTLMTSVRTSLQTAAGLAVGIGIAWALIALGVPGWVSVAAAVGLGTVLSGLPGLGPGRDYVPIAALFVLIIGGSDANDFSAGYLLQMALGMVVGLGVNLLIVPPLYQRESAAGIIVLRRTIADDLDAMADTLHADWPADRAAREDAETETPAWLNSVRGLLREVEAVETRVQDAHDSRRVNPRARWQHYDVAEDVADAAALRRIAMSMTELGDTVAAAIWSAPVAVEFPPGVREPIAVALRGAAAMLRAWDARDADDDVLDESEHALIELRRAIRSARAKAVRGADGTDDAATEADSGAPRSSDVDVSDVGVSDASAPVDTPAVPDEAAEAMLFSLRRIDAAVRSRIDELAPSS